MLKSLSIRNVVLIDKLDLNFQNGFSVLSGETGAGKSILLDSVGLLIGRRADVGMIRSGCDKLSVCGCFEFINPCGGLQRLCSEYDLDFGTEIIIKRTLDRGGHGRIFFNDQPITLKLLKEIGEYLIEIHGQFDNQGLLNPATHLAVLDSYGRYGNEADKVARSFRDYRDLNQAYQQLRQEIEQARREEENLRHWLDEFAQIEPHEDELENLELKRRELMHAEKIAGYLQAAQQALNSQPQSVREALRQAQSAITRANALVNDKFSGIYEVIDTALINAEEAVEEITQAAADITLNQNDIDCIEDRLFKLKSLARKHNTTVEQLPQIWQNLSVQLEHITCGSEQLAELEQQVETAKKVYITAAQKLSRLRLQTAGEFAQKIDLELPDLKMEKARFEVSVSAKPENLWNDKGIDEVCFLVSTNPGTPLGPLNKIASGGELARFMLALKVNLAQTSQIETMIFDEVDTGVGGATAQAVGDKLAKLGERVQVLVVTHSPQVAAQSRYHYKVEKHEADGTTITTLRQLNTTEKQEEIARMLSGETISDEARAAAQVLMDNG